MTSQAFQPLFPRRPSKGRTQRRKLKSTLNDGVEISTVRGFRQPGPSRSLLKIVPASENEVQVMSSSLTQQLSEEIKTGRPKRFIAFIGNLPFSANQHAIKKHFASLEPISIRHPRNSVSGKSKGFAFLEFAGYDRLKTCLKVYHHSVFDDGESPPRKINVELTAGGGGSSTVRKSKLRAKNLKLNQERKKRTLKSKTAQHAQLPHVRETHRVHPSRQAMIMD